MKLNIKRFEERAEIGGFRKREGNLYFKLTAKLTMTPEEHSVVDKYDVVDHPVAACLFINDKPQFNKKPNPTNLITVGMLLEGIETNPLFGYDSMDKMHELIKDLREGCQALKDRIDLLPYFVGESEDEFTSKVDKIFEERALKG